MKVLLIIVLIVLGMGVAGWITFSNQENKPSVTVETEEIKKDTKAAMEKGEELLEETKEKGRELLEKSDTEEDSAN